jgi:hypothetical protein
MDRKVGLPHCAQGQQSNIAHAQSIAAAALRTFFSPPAPLRCSPWTLAFGTTWRLGCVGIKLSMTAALIFALWILPGEVYRRR